MIVKEIVEYSESGIEAIIEMYLNQLENIKLICSYRIFV